MICVIMLASYAFIQTSSFIREMTFRVPDPKVLANTIRMMNDVKKASIARYVFYIHYIADLVVTTLLQRNTEERNARSREAEEIGSS